MPASDQIARLEPITISVPFAATEHSATLARDGFDNVLVRIETAGGAVGWGEASGASGVPVEALHATIVALAGFAIGQSVFATEKIRERLLTLGRTHNVRRLCHLAAAAIDAASWDACGRILNRPIHELIGGALRSEIDFFGYPFGLAPDDVAREAGRFAEAGFSVIYLKLGLGDERDEAVVRAVRTRVGALPRIRVDANEAWDLATARRMASRLERYGIDFLEQPTDGRNVEVMRDLRRSTPIPIAANQGIWSIAEAVSAIRGGACDVIVTGPPWVGGLLPLQRIGVLCAETGIGFCRHASPETSIGTAAGLQVLATLPRLLDGNQTYLYHLAEDTSETLAPHWRPQIPVPHGAGLGITVDEHAVRALSDRHARDGSFAQMARVVAP
jgi:L-alanine-DL-glutamate epimerase-like enolase superfamily enzyme